MTLEIETRGRFSIGLKHGRKSIVRFCIIPYQEACFSFLKFFIVVGKSKPIEPSPLTEEEKRLLEDDNLL